MIHMDRVFNVKTCSAEEMIADFEHTRSWTLCSAWRVGDTLYLNDSFSEDGAQEYAVVRIQSDGQQAQFESVTFGWMSAEEIARFIRETWNADLARPEWHELPILAVRVRVDHGDGVCPLCA